MDSYNLKTASSYINNLLLARGLLRDGKPIEFAHPSKGAGGKEATMAQIINLMHDLVLRRDVSPRPFLSRYCSNANDVFLVFSATKTNAKTSSIPSAPSAPKPRKPRTNSSTCPHATTISRGRPPLHNPRSAQPRWHCEQPRPRRVRCARRWHG